MVTFNEPADAAQPTASPVLPPHAPLHAGRTALIIGAGPSGLMAAEMLAEAGLKVTVIERMPTPARKLLIAGRGGLNLTNAEEFEGFCQRYSTVDSDRIHLVRSLQRFPPARLRWWVEDLGVATFVGTSGRIFPVAMKAAPMLRLWLQRLAGLGVTLETRTEWRGFDDNGKHLLRDVSGQERAVSADVTVIATGGASWPRLGSDGRALAILADEGLTIAPLSPSNVGVVVGWSPFMAPHFGMPLKRIVVTVGKTQEMGEAVITSRGLEGGVIYALSAPLRRALAKGPARITIDLRPDVTLAELSDRLVDQLYTAKPSLNGVLRKAARLSPPVIALLREAHDGQPPRDGEKLARAIKALPMTVKAFEGLDRAISTAGGVALKHVDDGLMLIDRPGVFLAGEMLDWDAPTGGYLLQMSFATGHRAAVGAIAWLNGTRVEASPVLTFPTDTAALPLQTP